MNETLPTIPKPVTPGIEPARAEVPFGVNELRLSAWQWLAALGIVAACLLIVPRVWKHVERFPTGPDYRMPYALSKDYWLYQRRLEQLSDPEQVVVIGDSVVWGEYVLPTGTLSHFLNAETGRTDGFVNGGVNGMFPLALEGLLRNYGRALHDRKVIVHWNALWLTSPRADLSAPQEEAFNHSRLVPQFSPRIPCYRADAAERISVVLERDLSFPAWVGHLQDAYFDQRSIPNWTLADDGGSPPRCPNAYRNPLSQINFAVPAEPEPDTQRGPGTARHKPWNDGGASPTHFDWVTLEHSLQWRGFQRTVALLGERGNDVLVIVGPFNEHMVAEEQRPVYRALRDGVATWLAENHVAHVIAETLPSELYADASHPLTNGYALLAQRICQQPAFRAWLPKDSAATRP